MAKLVKCKACGEQISKNATDCPKCGEPQKKKQTSGCAVVILFVLIAIIALGFLGSRGPSKTATSTSSPEIQLDRSPEAQSKREKFMQDLQSQGLVSEIKKPAEYAHVYVTPAFYGLDFSDKKSFIEVVFAYYYAQNPSQDIVVLYDSKSGNQVGTYTRSGLKME